MDLLPITKQLRCESQLSHRGFTAIELMVVIAIIGVLSALAAPSFKFLADRWRVRDTTETMITTLYYARSEAIKRGGYIGIQKNPKTTPGCFLADTNQEWGCGWFVFQDDNSDGKWQSSEVKLKTFAASANVDVIHQSGGASIKVERQGIMSGLNAKGFVISPAPDGIASPAARGICMSSGGRIKIIEDVPCKK